MKKAETLSQQENTQEMYKQRKNPNKLDVSNVTVSGVEKYFFLGPERQIRKFSANIYAMLPGKMVGKSGINSIIQ